ncbi:hypothetical protein [Kribbella ginsengisoli]|uniref:Tat pathway signal sequence domain protein n=1 Tax=Kribbella ginsengisoli TaxID=363865 RepID=A0ABP6W270_9ACTN
MPDPETDLLTEYVDERTPGESRPFEYVERALRRRRRGRIVLAVAATIGVIGGVATVAAVNWQRADESPTVTTTTTPPPAFLDVGPPPPQFKQGTTLLTLDRELEVTRAYPDPATPDRLIVETTRGDTETCVPHVVLRVLAQDAKTVRIAAYQYSVLPQSDEGMQCFRPEGKPFKGILDLHWELATRQVIAGSTGNRVVLN